MADLCPSCHGQIAHGLDSGYCTECGSKITYNDDGTFTVDTEVTVASLPAPADTSLATPTANPTYAQTFDGVPVETANTEPVPGDAPPGPGPVPADVRSLEDTEAIPGTPTPAELDAGATDTTALPQQDGEPAAVAAQPADVPAEQPTEQVAPEAPAQPAEEPTQAPTEGEGV